MSERAVSTERIAGSIRIVRGVKVILDQDLARLYDVETRALNQAVRRNAARFPQDFMFQLTTEEANSLRSQFVILDSRRGRHRKFAPYAFTEQGVAMLSTVLRSPRAVAVNIEIMRAFVELRRTLETTAGLARKLNINGGGINQYIRQSTLHAALLWKIGQVLEYNFFDVLSKEFPLQTTSPMEHDQQQQIIDLKKENELYKNLLMGKLG